ncbi:MAG: hypothetical protein CBB60_008455 [Armatimonadetes bacterium Cent15-Ar3]|nr:MAG: hypothetical protein CBB60_008455 [Armatimonadetes bacterium Cent15-Ar3]
MSEFERAFNIGRGYFDKAKDAILGGASADDVATAELDEALNNPVLVAQVEANNAEKQLRTELAEMSEEEARLVLGLDKDAKYPAVKSQHEKFLSRINEFAKNNPAKKQIAERERRRIEKAFALLSKNVDSTEKRFGTLEIE